MKEESEISAFFKKVKEAELTSYRTIVNSYYELELAYADHYRNVLGMKAWQVGPTFLSKEDKEDRAKGGQQVSINENDCLNWLESKKIRLVMFVLEVLQASAILS